MKDINNDLLVVPDENGIPYWQCADGSHQCLTAADARIIQSWRKNLTKLQDHHKRDLALINTMYDVLKSLKAICGNDVETHFSIKFAKQLDKAIEEAESL